MRVGVAARFSVSLFLLDGTMKGARREHQGRTGWSLDDKRVSAALKHAYHTETYFARHRRHAQSPASTNGETTIHRGKGYGVHCTDSEEDADENYAMHVPDNPEASPTLPLGWSKQRAGQTEEVLRAPDDLITRAMSTDTNVSFSRKINDGHIIHSNSKGTPHQCSVLEVPV